ncbi:hypothetical protein [Gemmatimonas sp.]|uniref:hypothetical protein n=1 Tax=Gemmatimonas sp. TaxID=1962908 RepID=UPI00286D08B5|nr:hypothetical protein [Gemmatimonas sp.]
MRTSRRVATAMAFASACTSANASVAQAQVTPTPAGATAPATPSTPEMRWRFDQCMGGVTYGAPFKWALSYGGGMVYEGDRIDLCALAVAKVGLGGAGASIGLAKSYGSMGTGSAITGGIIRTFGDPLNATARRTYVGGAVHFWPLLALGGEIGYYVRLGDEAGASAHGKKVITWSAGFGF